MHSLGVNRLDSDVHAKKGKKGKRFIRMCASMVSFHHADVLHTYLLAAAARTIQHASCRSPPATFDRFRTLKLDSLATFWQFRLDSIDAAPNAPSCLHTCSNARQSTKSNSGSDRLFVTKSSNSLGRGRSSSLSKRALVGGGRRPPSARFQGGHPVPPKRHGHAARMAHPGPKTPGAKRLLFLWDMRGGTLAPFACPHQQVAPLGRRIFGRAHASLLNPAPARAPQGAGRRRDGAKSPGSTQSFLRAGWLVDSPTPPLLIPRAITGYGQHPSSGSADEGAQR